MKTIHIIPARRPLLQHPDKDIVPIRAIYIVLAIFAASGGCGIAWVFTWIVIQLREYFQ